METDNTDKEQSMAKPWQFQPNKSGNPAGRPPGARNKATMICGIITPETLSMLETLSKPDLIGLIKRVGGACWGVGMMEPQEIAEAMKLRLAISGLTETETYKALPMMKEWFDRSLGKAPQSVQMTVENKGLSQLSDERLLRLERELARRTGQEAMVIAPMPKKLSEQ